MQRGKFARSGSFHVQVCSGPTGGSGLLTGAAFLALSLLGVSRADEVCDDFPDVHTKWMFRQPACGPTISFTDRPGFLRLHVPDGATAGGDFDNWTGADRAPSLERSDMGSGDWTISTRLDWEIPPVGTNYHVGIIFAFGPPANNDYVYWGEYGDNGNLKVERTGNGVAPVIVLDPTVTPVPPYGVSFQVEKAADHYFFRHRLDDAEPWTDDLDLVTEMASIDPVTRVGLLSKVYGGTGSIEMNADFDYFCLKVPGTLPTDVVADPIPTVSRVQSLTCVKNANGSLSLTWTTCPEATNSVDVFIAGQKMATVPPGTTSAEIPPPIPGGSIIQIEVVDGVGSPARCTITPVLSVLCDEFDDDPTQGDTWILRTPKVGPTVSVTDNPGALRFYTPAGFYDNWVGADLAPSLERYDMGDEDWVISTRFSYPDVTGPPGLSHHVGLMVGYGFGAPVDNYNDVFYWGEYYDSGNLKLERTGSGIGGTFPYPGVPVSLQIQKVQDTLIFSHRQDDADPWIADISAPIQLPYAANTAGSPPAGTPASRVGLLIKTWNAATEVTADFDYFCLEITGSPPRAKIDATPASGSVPIEVSFSGKNSTDPKGGGLTYDWDFGDGAKGTGAEVKHTYTQSGVITASLKVTDTDLNSTSATTTLNLSDTIAPWSYLHLGEEIDKSTGLVRVSGASLNDSQFCLEAGGILLGGAQDQGFFLERSLSGDFVVSAKVTDGPFDAAARLGLMARLDSGSKSADVVMSIDGLNDGYQFLYRLKSNGGSNRANVTLDPPRGALPSWIRLARVGSLFTGYYSTDGTVFTEYAHLDIPSLNVPDLLVGCAVASGAAIGRDSYCVELSGFPSLGSPPAAPTGLAATAGDGSVSLDWSDNAEAGILGYHVYRSQGGGAEAKLTAAPVASSSFNDTGLTNDLQYCYRVTAVNGLGEGGFSTQACATPKAAGQTFRRGDVDGNGKIEVTDAIGILGHLFLGDNTAWNCPEAADTDNDTKVDVTDAVNNLNFQFLGGTPPAAPGPRTCGPDDGPVFLGCNIACQ